MTDVEKLRDAQDFITRELRKTAVETIDLFSWGKEPLLSSDGMFRLTVYRGAQKAIFTFVKQELISDYGSEWWEKRLRERIGEILAEMLRQNKHKS